MSNHSIGVQILSTHKLDNDGLYLILMVGFYCSRTTILVEKISHSSPGTVQLLQPLLRLNDLGLTSSGVDSVNITSQTRRQMNAVREID